MNKRIEISKLKECERLTTFWLEDNDFELLSIVEEPDETYSHYTQIIGGKRKGVACFVFVCSNDKSYINISGNELEPCETLTIDEFKTWLKTERHE